MGRSSNETIVPLLQEERAPLVLSSAGIVDSKSREDRATTGSQFTGRWKKQVVQTSTPPDWLVILLSTLRRSTKQKRLTFNESSHFQYSCRVSDPYRNGHLFATLVSAWTGRELRSGSTGRCVNWLDSLLVSRRRPKRYDEMRSRPGSDYQYNLMKILQDKGGTMNLRVSYGAKMDRIETLRRELGAIVPHRSKNDRRWDVLPKLWLQSVWLILYAAWRVQQSQHCGEGISLKRKREHGSEPLVEAPAASDTSVESMNVAESVEDQENPMTIDGASPPKKKCARDEEQEARPLQNLDLNSVLDEEKARRLKAKAKEISLLQRFGLYLDKRSFESTCHADCSAEENGLGLNQGVSRKPRAGLRQHVFVGPALRCGSPSSLDRRLRRKRMSGDADTSFIAQSPLSSHKMKKNRTCERNKPDLDDTTSACEGIVPESSHARARKEDVCEHYDDDELSEFSFPQNDSQIEISEEAPRSPIVYDDVLLTDRAKLLLQNLERRRHAPEVPKSMTGVPPNAGGVQAIDIGLPTVTPKLSKRDRKKLKKEAKRKKKKSKRSKKSNLRALDSPKNVAKESVVILPASDADALSLESAWVSPDTIEAAQETYDDETCVKPLFYDSPPERNDDVSSPIQMATSGVADASSSNDEVSPAIMLCSESFLEQWGVLIQSLASGLSAASGGDRRRRKIRFIDTDLIEDIDIEFQGQVAVVIALLSQTKEVGFESLLRRIVDLAAMSKYKILHIFLCADVEWDDTAANGMLRLQNATMNARGLPSTVVLIHAVGPRSLASDLADCLLDGGLDHATEDCGRSEVEEFLAEPKIRERVLFLMSIAPSMSLGNAFRLVQAFCTEGDADTWFPLLITHAVSGPRLPDGIDLEPKLLQQLSFALSAPLAAQR